MTTVRILPLASDGSDTGFEDCQVTIRLVDSQGKPLIGLRTTDGHPVTSNASALIVADSETAWEVDLTPQSAIHHPEEVTHYSITFQRGTQLERWMVQVPESSTPVELTSLLAGPTVPAADILAGRLIPPGGGIGHGLIKVSATDYDVVWSPAGGGGVSVHADLLELDADDHDIYHTDARGDLRYSPLGHDHDGVYDPVGTAAAERAGHELDIDHAPIATALQPGEAATPDHDHAGVYDPAGTAAFAVFGHTSTTTEAHAASAISNTPAGNLAATTVQAALNELDSEKAPSSHDHAGVYDPVGTAATERAGHELAFDHTLIATALQPGEAALPDHTHTGVYDPAGTAEAEVTTHEGDPDSHIDLNLVEYTESGSVDGIQATDTLTFELNGSVYEQTLTDNVVTWTLTPPTAPKCGSAVVILIQTASAYSVAYPTTWYWAGGEEVNMPAVEGERLELILRSTPGGSIHASATRYVVAP